MKDIQRILSYMRRAVDDYGMIAEGDRIAVAGVTILTEDRIVTLWRE